MNTATATSRKRTPTAPRQVAFKPMLHHEQCTQPAVRDPCLSPNAIISVTAIKRWWRQRACLFENLAVLSARKLEKVNMQLKHREAQLRDAMFLVTYFKSRAAEGQDEDVSDAVLRLMKQTSLSQMDLLAAQDPKHPDYYEDEVQRLMKKLEEEIQPLLRDGASREVSEDFQDPLTEKDWKENHHVGYTLLKHWKRRCLEAEATVHRMLRDKTPEGNATAVALPHDNVQQAQYLKHAHIVADILNQTNRLLDKPTSGEDATRVLEYIDTDTELASAIQADENAQQSREGSSGGSEAAKKPWADNDEAKVRYWRQRYSARDLESRDTKRELESCQHELTKLVREVNVLRTDNEHLKTSYASAHKELDQIRELNASHRKNMVEKNHKIHNLQATMEDRNHQISMLQKEVEAGKIRYHQAIDAKREEMLHRNRVLVEMLFRAHQELEVRAVLMDDQVDRLRTLLTESPKEKQDRLGAAQWKQANQDLDAMEVSLFNMKAYLQQQRKALLDEQQNYGMDRVEKELMASSPRGLHAAKNVSEQVEELRERLARGIEFARSRIAVKVDAEKEQASSDRSQLIQRYHYEQILHSLQYLRDLLLLHSTVQAKPQPLSLSERTELGGGGVERFQRQYAPHLFRLYSVQASIALTSLETVQEIDGVLQRVNRSTHNVHHDTDVMCSQVQELQQELHALRDSSLQTVDKLRHKYDKAKKHVHSLQVMTDRLRGEKLSLAHALEEATSLRRNPEKPPAEPSSPIMNHHSAKASAKKRASPVAAKKSAAVKQQK